jgi:sulfur-oxidizing protein SoxX
MAGDRALVFGGCLVMLMACAWGPVAAGSPPARADAALAAGDAVPKGSSDGGSTPLSNEPGNAERGRAIVGSRQVGLCLLCHSGPYEPKAHQGTLAGPLEGAGLRSTQAQLRQRLINPRVLDPQSLMPAFYDTQGLKQVAAGYAGKPILSAQQIEDVVAYLLTLREAP